MDVDVRCAVASAVGGRVRRLLVELKIGLAIFIPSFESRGLLSAIVALHSLIKNALNKWKV